MLNKRVFRRTYHLIEFFLGFLKTTKLFKLDQRNKSYGHSNTTVAKPHMQVYTIQGHVPMHTVVYMKVCKHVYIISYIDLSMMPMQEIVCALSSQKEKQIPYIDISHQRVVSRLFTAG